MNDENKKDEKVYFFDKPENVKRVLNIFYSLCVILVLADFVVHRHSCGGKTHSQGRDAQRRLLQ